MIARIWHGWTAPENAEAYECLLRNEIFPGILARCIAGFRSIELLRRGTDSEVEFITVMKFHSLGEIAAFAGPDADAAVVPPKARDMLAHFDAYSQHYEITEARTQ